MPKRHEHINKTKKTLFLGMLSLIFIFSLSMSQRQIWKPDPCLQQVNEDGFGSQNNRYAWSMKTFGDHLYVGTLHVTFGLPFEGLPDPSEMTGEFAPLISDGSEIWRYDGHTWNQVVEHGFGDERNVGTRNMTIFQDHLYAGTMNFETGCELWRTLDGLTWEQVVDQGFGNPENTSVRGMAVWGNRLYVGTENDFGGELWSTDGSLWEMNAQPGFGKPTNFTVSSLIVHKESLFVGTWNQEEGLHIYRNDGDGWIAVVGAESETLAGFGIPQNIGVLSMTEFQDQLYVGTVNFANGFSLWRTPDKGLTWELIGDNGFGDARLKYAWNIEVHNGKLFLGTFIRGEQYMAYRRGAQLFSSEDGKTWDLEVGLFGSLAPSGFGNVSNYGFRTLESYQGDLYIGTAQCFFCPLPVTGTEIWRRSAACDQ